MSKDDYLIRLSKTGRNEKCPCGSGKKYKKCHLSLDEDAESKAAQVKSKKAAEELQKAKDSQKDKNDDQNASQENSPNKIENKTKRPVFNTHLKKDGKKSGAQYRLPRKSAV